MGEVWATADGDCVAHADKNDVFFLCEPLQVVGEVHDHSDGVFVVLCVDQEEVDVRHAALSAEGRRDRAAGYDRGFADRGGKAFEDPSGGCLAGFTIR